MGITREVTDEVWRYDNHQWDKYDNLVTPRYGHQSSLIGKNIIHIGGEVDDHDHFRFVANLN